MAETLKVGQVIQTERGPEKIVEFEYGNPVTVAVKSLEKEVRKQRASNQDKKGD